MIWKKHTSIPLIKWTKKALAQSCSLTKNEGMWNNNKKPLMGVTRKHATTIISTHVFSFSYFLIYDGLLLQWKKTHICTTSCSVTLLFLLSVRKLKTGVQNSQWLVSLLILRQIGDVLICSVCLPVYFIHCFTPPTYTPSCYHVA